jgi:para-aminobenzoate synthetase / 4-amino-4-deoxychorismate lyase
MIMQLHPGDALVRHGTRFLRYTRPVAQCRATCVADVRGCLAEVEQHVMQGREAVGFVAYEAAPAFDPAFRCHPLDSLPLVWFGVYSQPKVVASWELPRNRPQIGAWEHGVDGAAYRVVLARLRQWIAAGDTYQVNYTFPMEAPFAGPALAWFVDLAEGQRSPYSALLHLGDVTVVSVSPELFFQLEGGRIVTRPMKGTWGRGRLPSEDAACASALAQSPKDRAENLMIVDLLRNDLGRIAETGSVRVEELFAVERYPTVWQMTSTIAAETCAGVPEIFAALFPSGSVTGAPKVRTMEIIRDMEPEPRGVYCGAIGRWTARDRAVFSVAIRTAVVDHQRGRVRYAVGSGITWESAASAEYEECLLKAAVLDGGPEPFELLETLRWEGEFFLLREHLERLSGSAAYFDIQVDIKALETDLHEHVAGLPADPYRIRVLVGQDGQWRIERHGLEPRGVVTVCLAPRPLDRSSVWLYHKTTRRAFYETARACCPMCDDVILWNDAGEITESTTANIVVLVDGVWYTPPVSCGLLPGTLRAKLLDDGTICERVLRRRDLETAQDVQLINSVRGWMPVRWMDAEEDPCEMPLSARNGSEGSLR